MDFILTVQSMKRGIYLLLITILTFFAYTNIINLEKFWLIWSAFSLAFIYLHGSLERQIIVIFLTGLGIAGTVFAGNLVANQFPINLIYLMVITIICLYLRHKAPKYFYSFWLINIFAILALYLPVNNMQNMHRSTFIMLGVLIVLLCKLLFAFHYRKNQTLSSLALTLKYLKKLNQEIFSCFLNSAYPNNLYLFERRIHLAKHQLMETMCYLEQDEKLGSEQQKMLINEVSKKINLLYDNVLNAAQLRHRVTDHTVFAVCHHELKDILQAMNLLFNTLIQRLSNKNKLLDLSTYEAKLKRFEETYHSVVQITAREPVVFLLFISGLKDLEDIITKLYDVEEKLLINWNVNQ